MNILVFGTGSVAESLLLVATSLDISIKAFVDNNPEKWSTSFHGQPVISPNHIAEHQYEKIIIASSYAREIEEQLIALNVPRNDILFYPGHDHPRGIYTLYSISRLHRRWQTLVLPITSRCNLRCRHCVRAERTNNPVWEISPEIFAGYLQRFSPENFSECCLSGDGEATMHPDFLQLLTMAVQKGWNNLTIITNGTSRDRLLWEEIIGKRLLAGVHVSLEAATPHLYKEIRGLSYERLTGFLELVTSLKQKYSKTIKLSLNATIGEFNSDQILPILQLAEQFQISHVLFGEIVPQYSRAKAPEGKLCVPENKLSVETLSALATDIRAAREYAEKNGITVTLPEVFNGNRKPKNNAGREKVCCQEPYRVVRIRPDGSLYPCVAMPHYYPLGNINEADFLTLWQGKVYQTFLHSLKMNGAQSLAACRDCYKVTDRDDTLDMVRPDYRNHGKKVVLSQGREPVSPYTWLDHQHLL